MKRVLLVYQGRIIDLAALHWLRNKMKLEVYTYTPQLGGDEVAPEHVGEIAMQIGVESAYFGELKEKFFRFMLSHAIRCGIQGRSGSYLINALSRPVIAKEMVEIAEENACAFVAFSASPYSLDQIRYNSLFTAIAPKLKIISPQTEWDLRSFQDVVKYARDNNLPFDETRRKEYSIESNIWGNRLKCGRIEDLWKDSPEELYAAVSKVESAPDKPKYVELEFKHGLPVKLNGHEMAGIELLAELGQLGAKHGIGRRDMIGEELLGIKSRIIQEAPAAHIIFTAHRALEDITLSTEIQDIQSMLRKRLTRMVYEGGWFTDLREAACDFFSKMQSNVTGVIRLKLYKGNCIVMRRKAAAPLYKQELITADKPGAFPVDDIDKFLSVWNLSRSVEQELSSKKL